MSEMSADGLALAGPTKTAPKQQLAPSNKRDTLDRTQNRQRYSEAKATYGRGREISLKRVKDKKHREQLRRLELKNKDATLKARDAEILLEAQPGLLEPETDLEKTYRITQREIKAALPTQTARKGFELKLQGLGPYVADYTRNGRDLLLAGRKGHVATMDWREGKMGCELQLAETVRDAKWLHNNQYFATAQKKYVYIYDRNGVEIHKLDKNIEVTNMEFLPYHYLLATIGHAGYLKYTDTSTGRMVAELPTKQGSPSSLCQNPWNAIIHTGHQNGTVGLWSPNSTTPLAKILCHRGPVRACGVDRQGRYMVSCGQDSKMAVWDLRMLREVHNYSMMAPGASLQISDRDLVAVGWNTQVTIWQGLFNKSAEEQSKAQRPYMSWGGEGQHVERVRWCPLEDVLGVSHDQGFSSVLVPGAGEANYDSLEVNPFETTKQRQEAEVKGLLNKLQPETISLDADFIGTLDASSAAAHRKEQDLDRAPDDTIAKLKNRGRGKNSSLRKHLRKKGTKNIIDERKLKIQDMIKEQNQRNQKRIQDTRQELGPALARFASQKQP